MVLKHGVGGLNIDTCRAGGSEKGRFPTNIILSEAPAEILDKQSGYSSSKREMRRGSFGKVFGNIGNVDSVRGYDDAGGASRFFYVAKAGNIERYGYCHDCDKVFKYSNKEHEGHKTEFHSTVKPVKLIEHLVKMLTPKEGVVLDPFIGTGTTAVVYLRNKSIL